MVVVIRMAVRNLLRTRWRSGLTAAGIALSTLIMVWTASYTASFYDAMIRGSTDVELGHIQVQRSDYIERPRLNASWAWDEILQGPIEQITAVQGMAPRVRMAALVQSENHSFAAQVYGVDPEREPASALISSENGQGEWLRRGILGEAVMGRGVARALGVGVGDEVQVIVEGVEGKANELAVKVVGLIDSGSASMERQALVLTLEDAQRLAQIGETIHELVVTISDPRGAPAVARQVQEALDKAGSEELEARPWQIIVPGLYEMILFGEEANYIIYLIIFFIVGLGVLNTLRMSAQERVQEFGVMLAVGLTRSKLFAMVVLEGAILGAVGAVVGGLLGAALNAYFAGWGLDMGVFMESDFTLMGVSFSEKLYFVQTWPMVLEPALGLIVVTALCALWPGVWAIRLNPRDAISGRR